jgi:hypothetical protein
MANLSCILQVYKVPAVWLQEQRDKGDRVARYRRYVEGDHDANMTPQMRKMLRVTGPLGEFNDNYCDIVIQTMNDRIKIQAVEADNPTTTSWCNAVMDNSQFDALETDVNEAALRDEDTFILIDPSPMNDDDYQPTNDDFGPTPILVHEPAYDGVEGMVAYYRSPTGKVPDACFKLWDEADENDPNIHYTRLTVYEPNQIRRYRFASMASDNGTATQAAGSTAVELPGSPIKWTSSKTGKPLGIAVIHLINRTRTRHRGISELRNVIPLQDSTNRTLYSTVLSFELTAFRILVARGFPAPAEVTPGMVVNINPEAPLEPGQTADLTALPVGEISQGITMLQWLTNEIGKVSRTPAPEFASNDAVSGEALKSREVGLLGKIERYQKKAGQRWADSFGMAHKVQSEFSQTKQPPPYKRLYTRYENPELRDDDQTVKNATMVKADISRQEYLRILSSTFGWDEEKIDQILKEREKQVNDDMERMLAMSGPGPVPGGPQNKPPAQQGKFTPKNGAQ